MFLLCCVVFFVCVLKLLFKLSVDTFCYWIFWGDLFCVCVLCVLGPSMLDSVCRIENFERGAGQLYHFVFKILYVGKK